MSFFRTKKAQGGLIVLLLTPLACQSSSAGFRYPDSPRGEIVDTYHGKAVADPYRWLEEDSSACLLYTSPSPRDS